jgi:hypothetical protein
LSYVAGVEVTRRPAIDEHSQLRLGRTTSYLGEWLARDWFTDLSRTAVTEHLTHQVITWGQFHGFAVQTEVEAVATKRSRTGAHRTARRAVHPRQRPTDRR